MPAVQELCRKVLGKEPYKDIDLEGKAGVGRDSSRHFGQTSAK